MMLTTELLDRYPALVRYVRRLPLADRATEPEDIVQDVYSAYHQREAVPTSAELYAACRNRAISLVRSAASRERLALWVYTDAVADVEQEALTMLALEDVLPGLLATPGGRATVAQALGYQRDEIAAAWDWPRGTVNSRVNRTRAALGELAAVA
jgi:DNA-directed RNA polymerase specialized sigma24 family protein